MLAVNVWEEYLVRWTWSIDEPEVPYVLDDKEPPPPPSTYWKIMDIVIPAYVASGRFDRVDNFFGKVWFCTSTSYELAVLLLVPVIKYKDDVLHPHALEYASRMSFHFMQEVIRMHDIPTSKMIHYTILLANQANNSDRVMRAYMTAHLTRTKAMLVTFDLMFKTVAKTEDFDTLQHVIDELCPPEERARYYYILMEKLLMQRRYEQATPIFRELVSLGKIPRKELFQILFSGLLIIGNTRTARALYFDMKKLGVTVFEETDAMVIAELRKAGHSTKGIKSPETPQQPQQEGATEVKVEKVSEL